MGKNKVISFTADEETLRALEERTAYLKSKRPGSLVSQSEVIRTAILATGYKRPQKGKSNGTEDEE